MRVGKTLTEEELEDHVLYEADPVKVGELSAWRKCTILVLARYPLLHSVFWLSVVGWAALRATDDKQALLKAVIECWLVYSFGKYVVTGTCGFRGLRLLRGNDAKPATHWREEADAYVAAQRDAGDAGAELRYEDVIHVVAIPNYKEDPGTLRRTVATLAAQADAKEALVVVLAMEERDATARATAAAVVGEFGGCFRALYCTLHELKPGEVAGKSSNENWAVRCAKRRLCDELGARSDRVVVTVCDADTYFHARYFAALSCAYVKRDALARRRTFWQACTQFYPNCDDVPLVCGVRYALLSVGFLGQMANPLHYKLPFAVYSVALDLAVEARYWDPAVIPEDWHMFLPGREKGCATSISAVFRSFRPIFGRAITRARGTLTSKRRRIALCPGSSGASTRRRARSASSRSSSPWAASASRTARARARWRRATSRRSAGSGAPSTSASSPRGRATRRRTASSPCRSRRRSTTCSTL